MIAKGKAYEGVARGSRERMCAKCGAEFYDSQASSIRQKYCSARCQVADRSAKVRAAYPPKEEVMEIYKTMTDRELGRYYGHTYQWALLLRRHYGIAGRGRGKSKNFKSDRTHWGIHLKPEKCCRNCRAAVRRLHLHHAVPRSLAPAAKRDLRNGLPLCHTCHCGWHQRRIVIFRDVFTSEEWEFVKALKPAAWFDDRYPESGR